MADDLSKRDLPDLVLEDSSHSEYVRKPSGYILIDNVEVARTLRCIHGGEQIIVIKGSGVRRGFCLRCMGIHCAAHAECLHWEKRLDLYEKGLLGTL